MSGRTSGKTKVATTTGPVGQEQTQGDEGKPLASGHDPSAQSSKSPARDYSGVNVITAHSGLTQDNALLRLDTVSNSAATAVESTTEDSVMSQEVGDDNDPVGVEVAATTTGEEGNLVVMAVSGVSKAPDEDEGQNGETACAHSKVAVDSVTEVADAGETLLPQLVTSSTAEKVPPFNLPALQPASPPTIRLTSPPDSSHSSDKSARIFTTPGEVPPISMTKLATDIEDLRSCQRRHEVAISRNTGAGGQRTDYNGREGRGGNATANGRHVTASGRHRSYLGQGGQKF